MWHEDRLAMKASSGSTAAATEWRGTTKGEDEAGTSTPSSKRQRWPREYCRSVKF